MTPTGAALVAALANSETDQSYAIQTSGAGLGSRDSGSPPNALGLWVCEAMEDSVARYAPAPSLDSTPLEVAQVAEALELQAQEDVWLVEANVDDSTGEELGHALRMLRERAHVLDAWTQPIFMKKDRPGVIISALVETSDLHNCVLYVLGETSTFGVRIRPIVRLRAGRVTELCEDVLEGVPIKYHRKMIGGSLVGLYPEYEDCARAAVKAQVSLKSVQESVVFYVSARRMMSNLEASRQDSDDE